MPNPRKFALQVFYAYEYDSILIIYTELLMKKIPEERDLLRLFSRASEHWQVIGTGLGVSHRDLMPIPGQALNNLGIIFSRWRAAHRNVTWKTICDLCDNWPAQLGQTRHTIATFLESDAAHEDYGTTSDFDG